MSAPLDLLDNVSQAAALLKAMSNESRLLVLCSLQQGELSVGQLNELVPLSQSALSQHLAALRAANLVATRREGNTIYYRLHGEAPSKIVEVLHQLYCPR